MSYKMQLPSNAGLGLKPAHYKEALAQDPDGIWYEVHPENYMLAGGPRLAWLAEFAEKFAMSFHGVGLSLGGPERPDKEHLDRLKTLVDRFSPAQVSEHLAWSRLGDHYFADLLPPPVCSQSLKATMAHIKETQETLGQTILLENPSLYLPVPGFEELPQMWVEAAKMTGAGLLFDLNNILVCEANTGLPVQAWLDAVPPDMVGEIHLAGASYRTIGQEQILIDSHDAPVSEPLWEMLQVFLAGAGPKPVLIERDDKLPEFSLLLAEQVRAAKMLAT